jgi:SAM-dependent methyltransferase
MYQEIKECLICKSQLTEVFDLGMQFVVDFPEKKDESLLKAPLILMRCTKCSLIQLKHAVSGDRLYKKFWYRSGMNEQMRDELLAIVERASNAVELNRGDKVLDIGCNDGTLLGWFNRSVLTFGIDPCDSLVKEGLKNKRLDIGISDFFSAEKIKQVYSATGAPGVPKFKVITSVAMFYDLPDPVQFLKDCKELLHKEGVIVIQMNYLVSMLKDSAFDFISHEHRALYSAITLNSAVKLAGLEMQGIQFSSSNGGSIRAYVTHPEPSNFFAKDIDIRKEVYDTMQLLMLNELRLGLDKEDVYTRFAKTMEAKMSVVRKYISDAVATGKQVYAYGASTRGTSLMQYLYKAQECPLQGVAERDTNKYGRCMVGTWLPIMDEDRVRSKADVMLVLPWHFEESIRKRESKWLQGGGKLIFPLPDPRVITDAENTEPVLSTSKL